MEWKKASIEIVDLYERVIKNYICEKRQMFGFPVSFINNNMFAGVFEDGIFMRLNPADKEAILKEFDETSPFTPMGRTMKEYVFGPGSLFEIPDFCDKWLGKSYAFVSSLPPKEKGTKQKKSPKKAT